MNWLIFKPAALPSFVKGLVLCLLVWWATPGQAQDSHTSNTNRPWYLPDHAVLQFAGNIGLVSVGPGYSYARDKIQTDIVYGITPRFETQSSIHILTAKTAYHPIKINYNHRVMLEPLRMGLGVSYSMGDQFHTKWPDRYPDGYYWWTTSFRLTPFIGTAVSKGIGDPRSLVKRVQVYAELGSHDLAVISFFNNKNLPVGHIFNLALGTKLVF